MEKCEYFLQTYAATACTKTLSCGHACGGILEEQVCLPCLHGCQGNMKEKLKQDAEDMCMICFTEALSAAPAVQVKTLLIVKKNISQMKSVTNFI